MIVGIYTRVSTQEQAKDGYSIGEQETRLTKYCEALGWSVYRVYTDAGYSGATTERPALKELLRDVSLHKIEKVVVYKLDRLSRSQKDTLTLIEDGFLANGADFVSMSENFDTATPFGRAMVGILAVFAQLEREQIKERMSLGKQARAREGKFGGGRNVPIGYDYKNGRLVTNEYEKAQVLKIYELYMQGYPIAEIDRIMFNSGLKHKYGEWNRKTIRAVLRTRTYLGEIKYAKEWYPAEHEAFITEDVHAAVVKSLDERAAEHQHNKRRGRVNTLLGGLLVCGECGATMTKKTQGDAGRAYYVCNSRSKRQRNLVKNANCGNKSWRVGELDDLVLNEIKKLKIEPYRPKQTVDRSAVLRSEIQKLDSQLKRLLSLFGNAAIPQDALERQVKELSEQKLRLENSLADEQNRFTQADAVKKIDSLAVALEKADYYTQRALVEALIDHIVLTGDDVDIHWKFGEPL